MPWLPRRGPLRRYLEARGVLGGHAAPHSHTRLVAADGTRLAGTHLAGPSDAPGAVLLLHGFAANRRKPAYARLADGLSRACGVLALDLRGHGGSAGQCTWGDHEVEDVRAGLRWLQAYGYRRVALLGLSMGGTAAIHAAASEDLGIDVLATISAPAWFHQPPPTEPLQRLHAVWHSPVRRAALRAGLGVSLATPRLWRDPPHPVEMARDVTVPWLLVHGEDDDYFPPTEAEALAAAAPGPVTVWRRPAGFGHAEDGLTPSFVSALTTSLVAGLRGEAFPAGP
ncbi:MAG: alpha/beta fold hydrolase [Egicoccus sp.]